MICRSAVSSTTRRSPGPYGTLLFPTRTDSAKSAPPTCVPPLKNPLPVLSTRKTEVCVVVDVHHLAKEDLSAGAGAEKAAHSRDGAAARDVRVGAELRAADDTDAPAPSVDADPELGLDGERVHADAVGSWPRRLRVDTVLRAHAEHSDAAKPARRNRPRRGRSPRRRHPVRRSERARPGRRAVPKAPPTTPIRPPSPRTPIPKELVIAMPKIPSLRPISDLVSAQIPVPASTSTTTLPNWTWRIDESPILLPPIQSGTYPGVPSPITWRPGIWADTGVWTSDQAARTPAARTVLRIAFILSASRRSGALWRWGNLGLARSANQPSRTAAQTESTAGLDGSCAGPDIRIAAHP